MVVKLKKKERSPPSVTSAIKNKPSFVAILAWSASRGSICQSPDHWNESSPQGKLSPFVHETRLPAILSNFFLFDVRGKSELVKDSK